MKEIRLEGISKTIPEGFYDILGYIISAVYLVVGVLLSNKYQLTDLKFSFGESWVFDLFIMLIFLGGLYAIGTVLTTFSYWTILKPLTFYIKKFKNNYENNFGLWGTKILRLRINNPNIVLEMTKRYARLIMIRNICFVSLILTFYSITAKNFTIVYLMIFIITLITFIIRAIWLEQNFIAIEESKIILRETESKSKPF
ncbi:hypothetical protein [Hyunsoonleella ulvae]|uniref:hypothetical protein n=1 Tax=Hyunsoonleella ulvae TaxID=2799948 RepID=UPI0019395BE1|nr:hypothetical protein [Hyunsoonleella ulvae]